MLYQDSRWPLLAGGCAVALCWPFAVIALALVDLVTGRGPVWVAGEAVLLAVVALAFALRRPKMGFVLTDDTIILRGLLRNRSIPLRDVTGFGLRLLIGGPDARVVLERTDGSAMPVPALVFLSQADEIGRMIGPGCVVSHGVRLMQSEVLAALNTHLRRSRQPGVPRGGRAGAELGYR